MEKKGGKKGWKITIELTLKINDYRIVFIELTERLEKFF